MDKPRRRKWVRWLCWSTVGGFAVIVLLLLAVGYIMILPGVPVGAGHFRRNRVTYEAIIAEVRTLGIKPGEARQFKLDNFSNPTAMRQLALDKFGAIFDSDETGIVCAEMTNDGKLKVSIVTHHMGHFGSFGYAYSEVPLHDHEVPGGQLYRVMKQLDTCWWAVCYDLG